MYSGGRSDVCALVQRVCLPCLGNMTEDFEDALNQKQNKGEVPKLQTKR